MANYSFNRYGNLVIAGLTNKDIPFRLRNISGLNTSRTKYPNPNSKRMEIAIHDKDFAQKLIDQHWPLWISVPRVEYDPQVEPTYFLTVKMQFRDRYDKPLKYQPELKIYEKGVVTRVGEEFCSAKPNSDRSEFDDTYFEEAVAEIRLNLNQNTGKYNAFLTRFDGKLASDEINEYTKNWITSNEGEKEYY